MIQELLLQNEGPNLEFKEGTKSLNGILKAVVAFANTSGGIIVLGVEDKTKKVVGLQDVLKEEERLANTISDSIAPFLSPDIEIQTYRKKEIILIHIPHLSGPYYLKSAGPEEGVYIRFGSTNRVADKAMREKLHRYAEKISYDEIPHIKSTLESLDWDLMNKEFRQTDKKMTKIHAEDLKIITADAGKLCPTNGGIILFGLNRARAFPNAKIKCARFFGTDKTHIHDQKEITAYPTLAYDEAIKFVEKNTYLGAEFEGARRIDVPQYPPIAVREAIINAIVHADYSIKDEPIRVAIFDDRIEITNPGGLQFGMTLERAIAGSSKVRNMVIASVFEKLHLIEHWGSGLKRIINACIDRGFKKPDFENGVIDFKVTLYSKKIEEVIVERTNKEFLNFVKKNKKISTKTAAAYWNISPRNARVKLKKLLDVGLIRKIGTSPKDPKSGYILASPNKKK